MAPTDFHRGDAVYSKIMAGGTGTCHGCAKVDPHLRSHLHGSLVKILCPADGCEALTQDRPGPLRRHWKLCHSHLGPRPRALRVVLPVPRCKVRWKRKAGQRERHYARARVDSLVPSAEEWEHSQEARLYSSDGVNTGYDASGIVSLDKRFALPKKLVTDYPNFPVKYWVSPPAVTPEEDKWIWRSVGRMVGVEVTRQSYPSTAATDSDSSVSQRKREVTREETLGQGAVSKRSKKNKGKPQFRVPLDAPSPDPPVLSPPVADSSRACLTDMSQPAGTGPTAPSAMEEDTPLALTTKPVDQPDHPPAEEPPPAYSVAPEAPPQSTGFATPTRSGFDFLQQALTSTFGPGNLPELLVLTPRTRWRDTEELREILQTAQDIVDNPEPGQLPLPTGSLATVGLEGTTYTVPRTLAETLHEGTTLMEAVPPPVMSSPLLPPSVERTPVPLSTSASLGPATPRPGVSAPSVLVFSPPGRTIPVTWTATSATGTPGVAPLPPVITKIELLPIRSSSPVDIPAGTTPTSSSLPMDPATQDPPRPPPSSTPSTVDSGILSPTGETPVKPVQPPTMGLKKLTIPVRRLGLFAPQRPTPPPADPAPDPVDREVIDLEAGTSGDPGTLTPSRSGGTPDPGTPVRDEPAGAATHRDGSPVADGSETDSTVSDVAQVDTSRSPLPMSRAARLWYMAEAEDMREANVASHEAELLRIAHEEAMALAAFARRRTAAQEGCRLNREAVRRIQLERAELLNADLPSP